MKTPLQITLHDLAHSEALETNIRESADKLDAFHQHIVSCHVTVELLDKHQHKGRHFQARIDVRIPGREIVASHHSDEDVYLALHKAFLAARRQLEEAARVVRGRVKTHAKPQDRKAGNDE